MSCAQKKTQTRQAGAECSNRAGIPAAEGCTAQNTIAVCKIGGDGRKERGRIYRREGRYIQFMRQNVNGLFNREELKMVEIPLPPLAVQQALVAEIEAEQALVAANRELISRCEKKNSSHPRPRVG